MGVSITVSHKGGEFIKDIATEEELEVLIAFLRHSLKVSETQLKAMERDIYHEMTLETARGLGI